MARAIGNDRVIVAFEPDSLGTIQCQAKSRRDDRYRLLRYGVDALSKLPNVTMYLEAGASDWENAQRTAKQLRRIGIAKVRGFMLNATHYDWTAANIEHGLEISRLTGGKHFIINTAENGRGPVHYRNWIDRSRHKWRTINIWCSPGLRGLGQPPTTATSNPMVDAYLWINRPGFAQSCAGHKIAWFPPRAFAYARCHQLGAAAAGHALRALQALPAEASSGFRRDQQRGRGPAVALVRDPDRREPDREAVAASRYGSGLTGVSNRRTSQCRCGPVEWPVEPA